MSDQQKLTGGCLCAAVRYEAVGKPLQVAHCHCERCRRSTGAAFATGVCFPVEAVTWVQQIPTRYQSSGNFSRLFCSNCGSSVAQHNQDTATMWLLVGTLDHPESVTPELHIFTQEQLSWAKLDNGLPCHPTFAPTSKRKEGDESFPPELD